MNNKKKTLCRTKATKPLNTTTKHTLTPILLNYVWNTSKTPNLMYGLSHLMHGPLLEWSMSAESTLVSHNRRDFFWRIIVTTENLWL